MLFRSPPGVSLDVLGPEPQGPGVVVNVVAHERANEVVAVVVAGLHAASDGVTVLRRSCHKRLGFQLLREKSVRGALVDEEWRVGAGVRGHKGGGIEGRAGLHAAQVALKNVKKKYYVLGKRSFKNQRKLENTKNDCCFDIKFLRKIVFKSEQVGCHALCFFGFPQFCYNFLEIKATEEQI